VKKRGFLLITSLMITVILLLLGMGLLGSQSSRYEASKQSVYTSQARQLALAGLEDARIKLELDVNFPPPPGPGQVRFSYSESLELPYDPPVAGTYTVTVDMTHADDTGAYIVVTSVGSVGRPTEPVGQYRLRGEIDNQFSGRPNNSHGIQRNRFFRYTHIQDEEVP
jgi:Tfp pilus assembly protein PilX